MTPDECKTKLADNLAQSIACSTELQLILAEERAALEHNDTELLNVATERKQRNLNLLEELDRERLKISATCGFEQPFDRMPGVFSWCDQSGEMAASCGFEQPFDRVPGVFSWCDQSGEMAASWNKFLDIVATCNDLNSGNGAIIRVRQSQVRDVLELLRDGQGGAMTYGPSGQNEAELGTRSIAQA